MAGSHEYKYIVTCQAHPVLVKKANQMCGSFLCGRTKGLPGPVSCRCPSGLLETPSRWHATIYLTCKDQHVNWLTFSLYEYLL